MDNGVFELKMLSLAPNPATESVTINVEVTKDAVIDVYASSLQYGTTYGRVSTIQAACDASNIVTIDISTWQLHIIIKVYHLFSSKGHHYKLLVFRCFLMDSP